jgi:hypothetical protein
MSKASNGSGVILDVDNFAKLDDPKERDVIMFKVLVFLMAQHQGWKSRVIRNGGMAGGITALVLILIHDPECYLGKFAIRIVKLIFGG